MTLGQRVQELRKQAGLSQEGLGEALGVSRQAVSKWEGDNGIPELDTLIAMSRLFGVTVGQLLGVEAPEETAKEKAEEAPAGFTEEQVEEILRRYVEESRREEPTAQNAGRSYPIGSWIIAACAVILAVVVTVVAVGKVREVRDSINTLWSNVAEIESVVTNVRNQMGDLSSNIRDQVSSALEEQNNPISTFSYELVSVDLEKQTVTVRFDTTLKEYTAGSRLQILVDWVKVDDTAGQTVSGFVSGPDFEAELTFPMNYHAEVSIRVEDEAGNIREQLADYLYSFHPDSFQLMAYNLMKPFLITIKRGGMTTITAEGEQVYIDILSGHPEIYWPEEAEITAWVNGEEVFSRELVITPSEESKDMFCATFTGKYYELTLKENDEFQVMVRVTDNFGRVQEFWEGAVVEDGSLDRNPMAAPAVRYPD